MTVSVFLNSSLWKGKAKSKYKRLPNVVFIAQSTGFKDRRPRVKALYAHLLAVWSRANFIFSAPPFRHLWNCDSKVTSSPGNLWRWTQHSCKSAQHKWLTTCWLIVAFFLLKTIFFSVICPCATGKTKERKQTVTRIMWHVYSVCLQSLLRLS